MKLQQQILKLKQRLQQRFKTDIYYVADEANWAFQWVAHYIQTGIQAQFNKPVHLTMQPWELRHQIIHFGNRYPFFHGASDRLHPSNHVIVTWFHGQPDDPDPGIQQLFEKFPQVKPRVDQWVTSCTISQQTLLDQGIPPEKITLIPIGIDLQRFVPPASPAVRQQIRAELGIPPDAICIGSFQKDGHGSGEGIEPKLIKGPDVFLEAVEQLHQRYDNLVVLLTGKARGYVKQGLEARGIPYIHHFLADYHAVVRYYHALDGYLITSRSEGGPQALFESWATGVPLVSTRMGMPADFIRHGDNGMLADVEDAAGLASGMIQLLEDANLRDRCRQQALTEVQAFGWDTIARQYYQQLYQPILEQL